MKTFLIVTKLKRIILQNYNVFTDRPLDQFNYLLDTHYNSESLLQKHKNKTDFLHQILRRLNSIK